MSKWVIKGLNTGIVTTRYPEVIDESPGISPGLPQGGTQTGDIDETLISRCPTGALCKTKNRVSVERKRCVNCYRCIRGVAKPIPWDNGFEWGTIKDSSSVVPDKFKQSLHIRVVDSGDCGACLNEVKLLNNSFYNMHRLGFFITPTPRQADILIVVGSVTDHMKTALSKTYDAMPTPKRVMAVGVCALNGGVFKGDFVNGSGVSEILPVDVEIPGCPPPPLAIMHGLLVLAGCKTSDKSIVRNTELRQVNSRSGTFAHTKK